MKSLFWKETIDVYTKPGGTTINKQVFEVDLILILKFKDFYEKEYEYKVGENCISESMAYLIENYIYKKTLPNPNDFPYRVVKFVCDYMIPGFSSDSLRMIALCDACLMHPFPGLALYNSLIRLKETFENMTPEMIFDFVIGQDILDLSGAKGKKVQQLYNCLYESAKCKMLEYFTTECYDDMIKWIVQIFDAAYSLRSNNWHYMLDIARGKDIRNNRKFLEALDAIGCPVIMNNANVLTYIRNNSITYDVQPPILNVISQIYSIFKVSTLSENTHKCQLSEWCKNYFKKTGANDLTSEGDKCFYAPWERISTEELFHCFFGQIWFTWGLKNVKPVNKEMK